ncbi:MAG: hypothetical protein MGF17_00065 [Trichodesmium sp. MAG_R04]|nr:hypothetical protein [Trichodesmium sp. MAG_R04]
MIENVESIRLWGFFYNRLKSVESRITPPGFRLFQTLFRKAIAPSET